MDHERPMGAAILSEFVRITTLVLFFLLACIKVVNVLQQTVTLWFNVKNRRPLIFVKREPRYYFYYEMRRIIININKRKDALW